MPLPPPPTFHAPRLELGPVAADLQSPLWQSIAPAALVETSTGAVPNQGTALRLAASGDDLRVLFDCADRNPWATKTQRDDKLYEEETVEVFLDPVGDLACYFEIELNPLNTVMDLVLRRSISGYRKDFAWQCEGLRTAVQRTPHGWTAEFAIPFESLLPDSALLQPWRCNFCRIDRPKGVERELSAWSPTGRPSFHTAQRFGYVWIGRKAM